MNSCILSYDFFIKACISIPCEYSSLSIDYIEMMQLIGMI